MPFNDTYGEISDLEAANLRNYARPCRRCGMLATVDPVLHESRYGHAPVYYDVQTSSVYRWDGSAFRWEVVNADEDEQQARPGPGQAEDNYVNLMACGHELDDVEEIPAGTIVFCSVHGKTKIISD